MERLGAKQSDGDKDEAESWSGDVGTTTENHPVWEGWPVTQGARILQLGLLHIFVCTKRSNLIRWPHRLEAPHGGQR